MSSFSLYYITKEPAIESIQRGKILNDFPSVYRSAMLNSSSMYFGGDRFLKENSPYMCFSMFEFIVKILTVSFELEISNNAILIVMSFRKLVIVAFVIHKDE